MPVYEVLLKRVTYEVKVVLAHNEDDARRRVEDKIEPYSQGKVLTLRVAAVQEDRNKGERE